MDYSEGQAGSKLGRVMRQPLLFGLVAAGGVGLIAVTQMAGPPQADDKATNLTKPSAAEPVPAPDFGPVAAAAAESRIGGTVAAPALPAIAAKFTPAAAPVRLGAAPVVRQSAMPLRIVLPEARVADAPGKRRHTGSFAVPTASEASLAVNSSVSQPQSAAPGPTLVAYQPARQAAALVPHTLSPQLDRVVEAQDTPRSLLPTEPSATTALIVTPPAEAPQQSAVRSLLPDAPSGALAAPVSPVAEPSAPSPIVRAGSAAPRPVAASGLAAPQTQTAGSALALASPGGKSGIEGLAGLDDAQLSGVRPIIGEARQQAASAKRRGSAAGAARPNARTQTAEDTAPNPDKISAVGSGIDMHVPVQIGGSTAGNLALHIAADSTTSVRLGDLLSLVEGQMDAQLFKSLQASSAVDSQVSLANMRAAGMQLRYDAVSNQAALQVSRG